MTIQIVMRNSSNRIAKIHYHDTIIAFDYREQELIVMAPGRAVYISLPLVAHKPLFYLTEFYADQLTDTFSQT